VIRLLLLGLLLLGTAELTSGLTSDDRADELRAMRAGDGVETTGTVTATFPFERTERASRRSLRTVEVQCAEYSYTAGGETYTYRAYHVCDDVEVGDTRPLIHDRDDPWRAMDNTDAFLDEADADGRLELVLRVLAAVFLGLAALLLVLRVRGRRRSGPAA